MCKLFLFGFHVGNHQLWYGGRDFSNQNSFHTVCKFKLRALFFSIYAMSIMISLFLQNSGMITIWFSSAMWSDCMQ